MTRSQARSIGARAAVNAQRVQLYQAQRPARVVAAVAALASKWGALFATAPVDPAQVYADQVAQIQRVQQAVRS